MTLDAFASAASMSWSKNRLPIHVREDAQRMIAAYQAGKQRLQPELVFAAMFMQRTYGFWRKIKAMIDGGELGTVLIRCHLDYHRLVSHPAAIMTAAVGGQPGAAKAAAS